MRVCASIANTMFGRILTDLLKQSFIQTWRVKTQPCMQVDSQPSRHARGALHFNLACIDTHAQAGGQACTRCTSRTLPHLLRFEQPAVGRAADSAHDLAITVP